MSLNEVLKEGFVEASDTESKFSDQDILAVSAMLIEYLRDRFDLSDEKIIEYIQDFYSWVQEKYPDVFEYVQQKGS